MPHRSTTLRLAVGSIAIASVAALLPVVAQTPAPPAPSLLQLAVINVRPDMMKAYVDYQKAEIVPALQKAGVKWRESWRTAMFGDTFEVAHVTEIKSFDQYDSPSPLRTALGEAGYAAYQAKVATMITGARYSAIRTRPDLSYMADPAAAPPKMAILTNVEVASDKVMEFESFIKSDWIPALQKGGGKQYRVAQVVYGGSPSEYVTLVGLENFAELGKGHPVTRALGEEGVTKLMTKVGAFERGIQRRVIRLDPDMSFSVGANTQAR